MARPSPSSRRPGGATSRARPTWSRRWPASPATTPCRPTPLPPMRPRRRRRADPAPERASAPPAGRWPPPGYAEAVTWSFMPRGLAAALFGGGDERAGAGQPDRGRARLHAPSVLPNLIEAAARNAAARLPRRALFEIGPVFCGDRAGRPAHRRRRRARAARAAALGRRADRRPVRAEGRPDRPCWTSSARRSALQVAQGESRPWWHPGRSARLQLGPKAVLAEFGELHPAVLKALDVAGPGLRLRDLVLEAIPEPKRKAVKTRPALALSPLMPLRRDFAFVVGRGYGRRRPRPRRRSPPTRP